MSLVLAAPPQVTVPVKGGGLFPVRRVLCVGRNYVEHAIEMGHTGREPPFFFFKPADNIVPVAEGQTGELRYPSLTASLHHELELVVAVGVGGSDIPVDQALRHVFGYAVGLDMTRRDLQNDMKKQGRPWEIGKTFEQSAPIGELVRAGEVAIGRDTALSLTVNGQPRQSSVVGKLIWSIPEIIAHASAAWDLEPGDLLYTGTPEGVAAVVPGDLLQARVDGLPALAVRITPR